MDMASLATITLVKPEEYKKLDTKAAEGYFQAGQRVLGTLKKGLIDLGEEQLKAKTGFTNQHLPRESPTRTSFTLDNIGFGLITNVKINNPPYQTAVDKITGFLEVLINDWKQGNRRDNVRTYSEAVPASPGESATLGKKPFVELDYLMWNALWYISSITELGVENKFEKISAPELDELKLERLLIPVELMKNFDISKPGAAKLWYLARRFYDEVSAISVAPVKTELEKRTGITKEEMPEETKQYWEQIENYLFSVQSIPSPRREPGRVLDRLFAIPEKDKPKGSTALPVIITPDNYRAIIEEYRPLIPASLKKWKDLDGKVGELIIFYYGIQEDERVRTEFPFLPEYCLKIDKIDGGREKMFVSIKAVYERMKALEQDYKKNRLLRKHSQTTLI